MNTVLRGKLALILLFGFIGLAAGGILMFKYIGQDVTDRPPTEHLISRQSNPSTSVDAQELESIIDKYINSLSITKLEGISPPDFSLKTVDGKDVSLSDHRGKVVFLNFWATWCPPCRGEMPSMERLYQKFKEKDFVILAVSLRENQKTVEKFMKDYKLNFPVLLDSKGNVGNDYLVTGIPTTYLINGRGEIIGKVIGGRDWANEDSFNLFSALLEIKQR